MKIFALLLLFSFLFPAEQAVTANFISDPRSMFPRVMRTKNAYQFLDLFVETFTQMFRSKKEIVNHFNYYEDHAKGKQCYMEEWMDYGRLKAYFERYAATHSDPQVTILFAFVTKDDLKMIAEFHVRTQNVFGLSDHFHMIINAFNDEEVGWGVRYLSMAVDC